MRRGEAMSGFGAKRTWKTVRL